MKKLFISVPMKGRTEEAIKKSMKRMHEIAEVMIGERLEVIPSYIEGKPPVNSNEALWYLGESIKKMGEADYFAHTDQNWEYSGCRIESEVAFAYNIPRIHIRAQYSCPDLIKDQTDDSEDIFY